MNDIKIVYLECDCNRQDHMVKAVYFPQITGSFPDEDELYLCYHLGKNSLFERIKTAIKYIFGKEDATFQEYMFNTKTATELRDLLNEYLKCE